MSLEECSSDEEPPLSPTYGALGRTTAHHHRNGRALTVEHKIVNLGE
jgi:hypothetical protein